MKDEGSRIFFNQRLVIGVAWARGSREYIIANCSSRKNSREYMRKMPSVSR